MFKSEKFVNTLVSIIVPVYNVEKYLEECIESLLAQTLKKIEILLVDDGSNDASGRICDEYAVKSEKVKVYHQENSGQSVARNVGVSLAKGEYILFVDSDDYIVPETCEILYKTAKNNHVEIVIGDILNEKERIIQDTMFRYIPCENKVVNNFQYLHESLQYGIYDIVPWIRLVKREYLLKNHIEFLEGCFYEDQEYTMRLFLDGQCKVMKIRFPFYYYRMDRSDSTTNYASVKKGYDFVRVLEKMIANNMMISNTEVKNDTCAIIGIAYYHFCKLWLAMSTQSQKEIVSYLKKKKFYQQNHEKYIRTLCGKKYFRVCLFLKYPLILAHIERIKNKVKKC